MLAEAELLNADGLLKSLEKNTGTHFQQVPINCKKVKVFVRQEPKKLPRFKSSIEEDRFSGISWISPDGRNRLLVVAHLPDKRNY